MLKSCIKKGECRLTEAAMREEKLRSELSEQRAAMTKLSSLVDEKEVKYPAAELLAQHCFEDYKTRLDNYNRIYEKVNIALSFCGVILLVFVGNVDFSGLSELMNKPTFWRAFVILFNMGLSISCTAMVLFTTIKLIDIMSSRELDVFDSIAFRNQERYRWSPDTAALSLIAAYTNATSKLQNTVNEKQQKFDFAITILVAAMLVYAVSVITQKIGGIV
jgi:hypothetical protein